MMADKEMRGYLLDRLRMVKDIRRTYGYSCHPETMLMLMSLLSACASYRWPGKNGDKKRFVELLVRHSPADAATQWISIPDLLARKIISPDQSPWKGGNCTRIFRGKEIDLPYEKARARYRVEGKSLKKSSYASLLYERLRCPYVHEFRSDGLTGTVPASRKPCRISYITRQTHDGEAEEDRHMMVFDMNYLLDLVTYHVRNATRGEATPPPWWLDAE